MLPCDLALVTVVVTEDKGMPLWWWLLAWSFLLAPSPDLALPTLLSE
jgi:hypothetical protein